jgi:hypothetical protein
VESSTNTGISIPSRCATCPPPVLCHTPGCHISASRTLQSMHYGVWEVETQTVASCHCHRRKWGLCCSSPAGNQVPRRHREDTQWSILLAIAIFNKAEEEERAPLTRTEHLQKHPTTSEQHLTCARQHCHSAENGRRGHAESCPAAAQGKSHLPS